MYAGWHTVEVLQINAKGGALVKVVDGAYAGTTIACDNSRGFSGRTPGEQLQAFVEVSPRRKMATAKGAR